jgi:hypothetical protein
VGFEPTIPAFKRVKTVRALERVVTENGKESCAMLDIEKTVAENNFCFTFVFITLYFINNIVKCEHVHKTDLDLYPMKI